MNNIVQTHTAPGVYTSITNDSFPASPVSTFSAGILGEANMGPINVPTLINSDAQFKATFGSSLGAGFYLADTIATLLPITNNLWVERIAHEYNVFPIQPSVTALNTTVSAGTNKVYLSDNSLLNPANIVNNFGDLSAENLYVRITETAKETTVNSQVISIGSDGTNKYAILSEVSDVYSTNATIEYSTQLNAANSAESILYAYDYSASIGTAVGSKGQYTFAFAASGTNTVNIGDLLLLEQTGAASTAEVEVKAVVRNSTQTVVQLQTTNVAKSGYQALPLQATYSAATVYRANTGSTSPVLWLKSATEGTWANGVNASTGLFVSVAPGSNAGTKKLNIYLNSSLVQAIDNLSIDPTNANFYGNIVSPYIAVTAYDFTNSAPSNTANPWDTSVASINAGASTGGTFTNGFNGELTTQADYIGNIDDSNNVTTGVQAFADTSKYDVYFLAAPGVTDRAIDSADSFESVQREFDNVASIAGAISLIDVPDYLNLSQANDWHNGVGVYSYRSRINSTSSACFWNWLNIADQWSTVSGATKWAPPVLGALRCLAYTFNSANPWRVAAGTTYGAIPEAIAVRYTKASQAQRDASYGNGNSVNPILWLNGQATLFGERTMAVAESELAVIHCNTLVHTVLDGMAAIGRKHTFEPNDKQLVTSLTQEFTAFLSGIQNSRGMESYAFTIDNSAANRSKRQVVVSLELVPTEDMERMFINAAVFAAGAQLVGTTTA